MEVGKPAIRVVHAHHRMWHVQAGTSNRENSATEQTHGMSDQPSVIGCIHTSAHSRHDTQRNRPCLRQEVLRTDADLVHSSANQLAHTIISQGTTGRASARRAPSHAYSSHLGHAAAQHVQVHRAAQRQGQRSGHILVKQQRRDLILAVPVHQRQRVHQHSTAVGVDHATIMTSTASGSVAAAMIPAL